MITGIESGADNRRRFRELGMTDGETVECVLRGRGISAYLIKGTLIALRSSDAALVSTCLPRTEDYCEEGGVSEWL